MVSSNTISLKFITSTTSSTPLFPQWILEVAVDIGDSDYGECLAVHYSFRPILALVCCSCRWISKTFIANEFPVNPPATLDAAGRDGWEFESEETHILPVQCINGQLTTEVASEHFYTESNKSITLYFDENLRSLVYHEFVSEVWAQVQNLARSVGIDIVKYASAGTFKHEGNEVYKNIIFYEYDSSVDQTASSHLFTKLIHRLHKSPGNHHA